MFSKLLKGQASVGELLPVWQLMGQGSKIQTCQQHEPCSGTAFTQWIHMLAAR